MNWSQNRAIALKNKKIMHCSRPPLPPFTPLVTPCHTVASVTATMEDIKEGRVDP